MSIFLKEKEKDKHEYIQARSSPKVRKNSFTCLKHQRLLSPQTFRPGITSTAEAESAALSLTGTWTETLTAVTPSP